MEFMAYVMYDIQCGTYHELKSKASDREEWSAAANQHASAH